MNLRSTADLTAYDWLTLSVPELARHGVNPLDRVHYIGHKRAFDPTWLPSFGNWGVLDTKEMINTKEPHRGRIKVRASAYRQFRARQGLLTGSEFTLLHGPEPWLHAELSYVAYQRRQALLVQRNGVEGSLGQVCRLVALAGRALDSPLCYRLGLLPGELVLYVRLFHAFLRGAAYSDWHALEPDDKAATWALGPPDHPRWDIDFIARAPGVRHLPLEDDPALQAVG